MPNLSLAETEEPISPEDSIPTEFAKGEVVEIISQEYNKDYGAGLLFDYQEVKVKITSGPFKGEIITIENTTTGNPAYDIWVSEGDKVLLILEILAGGIFNGYIADFPKRYLYICPNRFVHIITHPYRCKTGIKVSIHLRVNCFSYCQRNAPFTFCRL